MRRGGKPAHIGTDFRDNHLGTEFADTRNGGQQGDGGTKGFDAFVYGAVDLAEGGIERSDLLKMQPQQKTVMRHDAAVQRLAQLRGRRLDAVIGKGGELGGIGLASDNGLDDGTAG